MSFTLITTYNLAFNEEVKKHKIKDFIKEVKKLNKVNIRTNTQISLVKNTGKLNIFTQDEPVNKTLINNLLKTYQIKLVNTKQTKITSSLEIILPIEPLSEFTYLLDLVLFKLKRVLINAELPTNDLLIKKYTTLYLYFFNLKDEKQSKLIREIVEEITDKEKKVFRLNKNNELAIKHQFLSYK